MDSPVNFLFPKVYFSTPSHHPLLSVSMPAISLRCIFNTFSSLFQSLHLFWVCAVTVNSPVHVVAFECPSLLMSISHKEEKRKMKGRSCFSCRGWACAMVVSIAIMAGCLCVYTSAVRSGNKHSGHWSPIFGGKAPYCLPGLCKLHASCSSNVHDCLPLVYGAGNG